MSLKPCRSVLPSLLGLVLCAPALAQEGPFASAEPVEEVVVGQRAGLGGGLFFGGPLGASALAEFVYGLKADVRDEESRVRGLAGVALQLQAGTGGGKLSLGLAGRARIEDEDFHGTLGAGLKVSVLRTWGDPVGTAAGLTYLGPELDFDLKRVSLGLGVLWRVRGQGGSSAVFSWGLGFRL